MNKLVKTVSRTDLYREFLNSLNGILKLTDREFDLIKECFSQKRDRAMEEYG